MSPDLFTRLEQRFDDHAGQQLTRVRSIKPEKLLDFTSNDYLGLGQHPKIIETLQNAIHTFGLNAQGSPITHYLPAHQALEKRIATWLDYPRALVFTSGYLAVICAITALAKANDVIAVDKQCHASVFDAIRLTDAIWQRYDHTDEHRLEHILKNSAQGLRFIITSSVFSMQGNQAHLNQLMQTAQKYNAMLIIDDVHGTGILGPEGQGCVSLLENKKQLPLVIGSLTKGLGTLGAFVAGDEKIIEALVQFARPYMFSTTIPSAYACASVTAIDIASQAHNERNHLQQLITYFQQHAQDLNALPSTTPIQAIAFSDIASMQRKAQQLLEKGIIVSAIRPPTVPKHSPRIRITFTANHQLADLDRLIAGLKAND